MDKVAWLKWKKSVGILYEPQMLQNSKGELYRTLVGRTLFYGNVSQVHPTRDAGATAAQYLNEEALMGMRVDERVRNKRAGVMMKAFPANSHSDHN